MSFNSLLLTLLILLSSTNSWSKDIHLKIEKAIEATNYILAKKLLPKLGKSKIDRARRFYFNGLINTKEENYTIGANLLRLSLKFGRPYKNVYYEIGQAYYADNELTKSLKYFRKSIKIQIKANISIYYLAHINQILEKFKRSIKHYKSLINKRDVEPSLQQISLFQLAEVTLTASIEKKSELREIVKKDVLPLMRIAKNVNIQSGIIPDINKRIYELKKKYGLDQNFMINGRRAPAKKSYRFSQGLSYDNNITYANEIPTSVATLQDSFIFKTNFTSTTNYIFDNTYTLTPSYGLNYTKHSNDENPDVYQNDSYSVVIGLGMDYDFKLFGSAATWLTGVSLTYTARDWEQTKNIRTSGNTFNYKAGLRFKVTKKGDTTLNYSNSSLKSYSASLDSDTTSFSIMQNLMLDSFSMLLFFYQNSSTVASDTTNNTVSRLFRLDYLMIESIPSFTFQYGVSLNQQELEFQPARGLEKTLTGSIKATKKINSNMRYSVSYEYSDKSSDDNSFGYNKEVLAFQLKLNY